MIYQSAIQLIGDTPLYQFKHPNVQLYAKLENQNIGGSVKDRLGYHLIERALQEGLIQQGDTVVEPTAGNTGIGLAIAAQHFGVELIVTVPAKFSIEKQQLMRALGAKVIETSEDEGMDGAITRAEKLVSKGIAQYMPNQFDNEWNPEAYVGLADELMRDINGNIDVLIAGGGSGGTLVGVARRLREYNPHLETVLVQPVGATLEGHPEAPYAIEGIGMSRYSTFINPNEINKISWVSDEEAFQATRHLARHHSLLLGSSSGAAYVAMQKEAEQAEGNLNIVTIFPDRIERYLQSNVLE